MLYGELCYVSWFGSSFYVSTLVSLQKLQVFHWDTLQNLEPSERDTVTPGSAETTFDFFVVVLGKGKHVFFYF